MKQNFIEIFRGKFLLIMLAGILFSCAEEDPNLVNPPSPSETVRIRFFNYASDLNPRRLALDEKQSPETPWKTLSPAIIPPLTDSVTLSTILNGEIEYTDSTKLKIWRDTRYIAFALPKPNSPNPVDTLVVSITAFAPVSDTNNCYISLINIHNEPDTKYSVVVGCPNGNAAFPAVKYMDKSVEREVPSGNYPVSIIKIDTSGERTSLGLFDLHLHRGSDYLFVIMGDIPEDIKLIDRRNDGPDAITQVDLINATVAKIRTINFSTTEISAEKTPGDLFLPSLSAYSISDYRDVSACTSDFLDSIVVNSNGEYASSAQIALVVNSYYTLLVFDAQGNSASKSLVLPNLEKLEYPPNHAAVRVVNMAENFEAFSMSLGARDDLESIRGYRSGEQLATNLEYGKVSGQTFVLAGRAPISIFSATSPQRLLHSYIGNFEAGKDYLVVVTSDNNDIKLSIIEEEEINEQISNLPEGEYAQFALFTPSLDSTNITVDNILTRAKLYYSTSFATVLPRGTININAGGASLTFNTEKDYRDLVVLAGTETEPDFIHIHTKKMAYNSGLFNRRFINAAKDVPLVTIYDNDVLQDTNIRPVVVDLPYGKTSDPQSVFLERKFSYFFFDKTGGELLLQVNDIFMSFGKNYSIIFGGDKTVISQDPLQYNYSILLIQEY
jgi:hypothetical protein